MSKVNIGIVGLRFGSTVIEDILGGEGSRFFHVYGVCDMDHARTDETADKYKAKPFYTLESLLADPDVHAIGLYTPPAGRAELIDKILRSGRDVITTKPFELDPHEALQILNRANEMQRVVHLNSPGPNWHETLRRMQDWSVQYDLGMPIGWRADVWVNYREKRDGGWYDDPEKCPVAPIFRLGIYIINDMVRLFGPAQKVSVMSTRLITERPTADNSQLSIQFRNGALANLFVSFCVDDSQRYKGPMIINFERGTIYCDVMPASDGESAKLLLVTKDKASQERVTVEAVAAGGGGQYQWEAFHDAIIQRKLNDENYIREIVEGLKIIDAMRRADQSGMSEIVE
jgi:predicted dehydrogenase